MINEIRKHKFQCYKTPKFFRTMDIDKIVVFKKIFSGFSDYMDDDYKIKSFSIILPKTSIRKKL